MRGKLHLSFFCPWLLGLVLLWNFLSAQKLFAQSVPAPSTLPKLISLQVNLPEDRETANLQVLFRQGQDFYNSGHFPEAIQVLQYTADVFKNQRNYFSQAVTLINLSLAYEQLGQWEEAEKAIANSLNLLNSNPGDRRYRQLIAQVWEISGQLKLSMGKPQEALKFWQDATQTYHELSDLTAASRNTIKQSLALQELGQQREALKILISLLPTLEQQSDLFVKAMGWRSLGNVLRVVGEVPELEKYYLVFKKPPNGKSLTYLEQSKQLLEESLKITDKLQLPQESSVTQLSLANTLEAIYEQVQNAAERIESRSKKEQAAQKAEEVLTSYQQIVDNLYNNRFVRIQAQLNYLNLKIKLQQLKEFSSNSLSQITSEIDLLPVSREAIYARINLVKSLMKIAQQSGNKSQFLWASADLLKVAIPQAQKLGDRPAESYARGYLGKLYEQNQQFKEAMELTQQALLISEEIQAKEISYQWQWQLGRLAKKQEDRKKAIAYYQEAIKSLDSVRLDLSSLKNPEVQFSFRDDAEPIYRELVDLLLPPLEQEVSQANIKQAQLTIEALQLAELENYLRCQLSKSIAIDKVIAQHNLKTAIIYPIVLEDRLEVILKLPGQEELIRYTTLISKGELETKIKKLQENIEEGKTAEDPTTNFAEMYKILLKKAEPYLKNHHFKIDTLLFVLDGSLQNIPMASLYDGNSYLIGNYSIVLNLGLQLVEEQPLEKDKFNVLVAGLSEKVDEDFSELPYVKEEVKVIPNSTVLLNSDFTFNTLQQKINSQSFSVVHLATHGLFSSNPDETFIWATNQEKINVNRLINLLRSQQQNQPNSIKLLTLSACQTAKGDKWAALGIAGVAVRSGARSTIASLSNVPDESTALMMSYLYEELGKPGITKAEALRSAQRKILQDPKYKKPFYWSSFILLGSWR